ncbi:Argonaute complex, subunit Arb1 [Absidia repens]|uniref:Argonaute complex, subunit Arb1 n=1 Tax=Absidia repens TaxID=90262 RepID=A0A1X2IF86_9FUNG|nr:Argonaute complex, subunit Arb1 [Absidia repens]
MPTEGSSTPTQPGDIAENNHKEGDESNNDSAAGPSTQSQPSSPGLALAPKKKKKKKKSKTANLPEAGSALADDYQEKYNEDVIEDPYEPSRPLARRVEYAIWKYRRNHKFSQEKKAIFDEYLKFGGVDTSPNAFLGRTTSADTPDDPDAEADFDAAKTATDAIDLNDSDAEEDGDNGHVSFSEVVQVYLGKVFVHSARFISLQDYVSAPILVDSFLRYLQIRNVCPEYADDLVIARRLAETAKDELPRCKRVSNLLPGEFNGACGVLYGNDIQSGVIPSSSGNGDSNNLSTTTTAAADDDLLSGMSWNMDDAKVQSFLADVVGMTPTKARRIIGHLVPDVDTHKVVDERHRLLVKIIDIDTPPVSDGTVPPSTAASSTTFKVILAAYDEDLEKILENDKFELYFEKEIVDEFLVGMVMQANMRQLSSGMWYLDRAYLVCPTFYKKDEYEELEY